ncbi:DISARM system phospholipase D-like protein DrmC [Rhodovulum sp. YNF3179]|uniref:DISARM system phospholipase D-like protein DrmC n=1 Tax=Rhodovulum sp. YNF3179 TaxID=3425127 RepID=UPI003D3366F9
MNELLEAVIGLVSNTPPARVEQFADRIARGMSVADATTGWAISVGARQRISRLETAAANAKVTNSMLAGLLVGAAHAYHREKAEEVVELVLTGPSTPIVATRRTESALLQVIDSANSSLFLTSFVAYDVAPVLRALKLAIKRGVEVALVLESSEKHGGEVSFDVIGKMRSALPGAQVFFWKEKAPEFTGGKVHAKVAVADRKLCFVSSANLTGHAFEKNIEAGVLIEGGDTPRRLEEHLEALVTTRIIASS